MLGGLPERKLRETHGFPVKESPSPQPPRQGGGRALSRRRDNRCGMRIFSGIQPTGAKHFGNYSGGFRQYAATQERGEAFFCIVDLHSITIEHDPAELPETTLELAVMLFVIGISFRWLTVFGQ